MESFPMDLFPTVEDERTIYYLSGPMTGLPRYNYDAFEEAAKWLREGCGFTVVSPHEIDGGKQVEEGATVEPWKYYMTKAIHLQMVSNAWVGLPGWTKSRGARREFDLACDLEHELYLYDESAGLVILR